MDEYARREEAERLLVQIEAYGDGIIEGDRERKFVEDFLDKFERFKDRTFVSERQLKWLRDIEGRIP